MAGFGALRVIAAIGLGIFGLANTALAQTPISQDPKVERLARDVERAEGIRNVKNLQIAYQQFAQFGLWDAMADLFSDNADFIDGNQTIHGRTAIQAFLIRKYGNDKIGLPAGALHNEILLGPVVTLSYDGDSAQGRWSEVTMLGGNGGEARWEGGMEENDYVREKGVWKISRLHYYPQFAGPYETGWFSLTPTSPIVPYHYMPDQAGRPVPAEAGDYDKSPRGVTLFQLETRIQAMNDEDKVRNLQNIYGYYVDRKMWDDVTDLFTNDAVLEIAGVGVYDGIKGIRRKLEQDGPARLKAGQVNDHLQLDTIVTIEPGGREARARGMELGMLTPKLGEAYWSLATFENRYVKGDDGKWRIREMRIFPKMKTDYYQGWGKSIVVDPPPGEDFAPDHPAPIADIVAGGLAVPVFFFPHPVTGKPVVIPAAMHSIGTDRIAPAPDFPVAKDVPITADNLQPRVQAASHKLDLSKAYDAVENVSSSCGYFMDDFLWDAYVENISENGRRIEGAGWYVGKAHVYQAMTEGHIGPPSPTNQRNGIRVHMRTQPVIDVAPDGKSATIRTRMWLYYANTQEAGAWNSGMYPNDAAVLENGVWKIDVNEIDETYFSSPSYKQGWAKPTEARSRPTSAVQGNRGASRNSDPISFPPDVPNSDMASFRRKDFSTTNWPEIKPMWFAYRNPVSGRYPTYYCPDMKTCH